MYGYGYKYVNGLVVGSGGAPTPPPYSNTKSLLFDGVNDYLDLSTSTGLSFSNDFTLSAWVKTSAIGANQYIIDASTSFSLGHGYSLRLLTTGAVRFWSFKAGSLIDSTTTLLSNTWYHIAATHDRTGLENKIYINGVLDVSGAPGQLTATPTTNLRIGTSALLGGPFNGNIDEVSFFNRKLIQSEITTLSTAPTVDLTGLNPVAWYRNGDNGAYKSPQWLIPNNENKDKVSNYSMDFDGVGDKVSIGTALNLGVNSTVSFWIKRGRVAFDEVWLGEGTYANGYLLTITVGRVLYFRIGTAYVGWDYATVKNIFNNITEWVNVCVIRSGNSIELFLNGISYGTGNIISGLPGATVTRFDTIGAKPSGFNTLAQFDEVVAWNTNTVNPLDIYNGGTPTTIVGASSYWKMGDNSTFLTNWTVPDAVGSNDGTSANMTIEDRIGEAPNSENNAVSLNMDFVDVVPDTP